MQELDNESGKKEAVIECDNAMDDLHSLYWGFIPYKHEEWDGFLPENPAERFELFKKSVGEYFFLREKRHYLDNIGTKQDIEAINAEKRAIEKTRNDPKLKDDIERASIIRSIKYKLNPAGNRRPIKAEQLDILSVYALLKSDYFNNFLIHEKYFVTEGENKTLGEVYGRYFRFYEYLENLSPSNHSQPIVKHTTPKKLSSAEMKRQSFKEIWHASALKYYEPIMRSLLELKIEGKNCVVKDGNQYRWTQQLGKGCKSYLAAFFIECERAKLLDDSKYEGSRPNIRAILKNTFAVASTNDPYINIENDWNDKKMKYKEPFRSLIKGVIKNTK